MSDQLKWLHRTLLNAERDNEFVHILGHVPPKTASCVHAWNREYEKIVLRFAHIISGQFFGHTHRDEFNIFYARPGVATNVAWTGGSGTSFIGLNSNYRIYYAAPETFVRQRFFTDFPFFIFPFCRFRLDLTGNCRSRNVDFQFDRGKFEYRRRSTLVQRIFISWRFRFTGSQSEVIEPVSWWLVKWFNKNPKGKSTDEETARSQTWFWFNSI